MNDKIIVGIADMKMAKGDGMLVTFALGSCIGICLYDPEIQLGALVHIMLPLNMEAGRKTPMKYADTGIRETLKAMELRGAKRQRITAKIAGGAKMFEVTGQGSLGAIGQRNIDTVHLILKQEKIRLLKENVGGTAARTLWFDVKSGQATIQSYGKPGIVM